MKWGLPFFVLILALGVAGLAQNRDAFHGVWRSVESKSKRVIDDPVKEELITIEIKDNVHHNINQTTRERSKSHSEYTVPYTQATWAPSKNLLTGQSGGSTMMLRVEPTRELRISKNAEGKMTSMVLRTVLEDGKTMKIFTFQVDGRVTADLILEKVK
jgi:hypothetical protein